VPVSALEELEGLAAGRVEVVVVVEVSLKPGRRNCSSLPAAAAAQAQDWLALQPVAMER
jgi:hypothetical protein